MAEDRRLKPQTVSWRFRRGLTPRYVEWALAKSRSRNCPLEDVTGPDNAAAVRSLAAHWGINKRVAFITLREKGVV